MRFYLSSNRDGRVILDTVMRGAPIDAIDAEPEYEGDEIVRSAWQAAREQISEYAYRHEYGHGYFLKE